MQSLFYSRFFSSRSKSRRQLIKAAPAFVAEALEVRQLLSSASPTVDVSLAVVGKGQVYDQTSAAAATVLSTQGLELFAGVNETSANTVNSATITPPGGTTQALSLKSSQNAFKLETKYNTQAALDTAYPDGTYQISMNTVDNGNHTFSLGLTGDAYPVAPYITDFSDIQGTIASSALTVNWNAMSNGTTSDFVVFGIDDDTTNTTAFETPNPGSTGVLNGTVTGITVPAGTLVAGHQYSAWVDFIKGVAGDVTSYPGAEGGAVYMTETDFNFTTASATVPTGALEIWAGNTALSGNSLYSVDQNGYTQLGVSNTPDGNITFSTGGVQYSYFVIASRGEDQVDAVQGSDGSYLATIGSTGDTSDNGTNMTGAPDGNYTTIGTQVGWNGTFAGYVEFANPDSWTSLTVHTGSLRVMLQGQISVDNSYLPGAASPFDCYGQIQVDDNGLITSGEVRNPAGVWYPLSLQSGQGGSTAQWQFELDTSSLGNITAAMPNGTYVVLVNSPLGTTTTQFSYTAPSLAAVPTPIGLVDGSTGVSTSPTITWNAFMDSNVNDNVELQINDSNYNTVIDQQMPTGNTSYGPVALSASSNYELQLRLNSWSNGSDNADGYSFSTGITNETDLDFSTSAAAGTPDLNLTSVNAPSGTVQPGDWITLPVNGSNSGSNAIGNSSGNVVPILYEVVFGATPTWGAAGNIVVAQNTVGMPGFLGGQNFGGGGPTFQVPASVPEGSYYVGLKIDSSGVVSGNTGNTTAWTSMPITITASGTIGVTAAGNQSATAGQSQSFTLGNFTQSNANTPFAVDVNWGDGSADSVFLVSAAGTIPNAAHVYDNSGNETVTVTVSDWGGEAASSSTFHVNVASAPITVIPPGNQTATTGESQSFVLGNFTQTGTTAPYSVDVNWGDGSPDTIVPVATAGTIPATAHIYTNTGNDTVTLTVTDSGNHSSNIVTFNVFVTAQPTTMVNALASFNGTDGSEAQGGLLIDSSGNLYGTTNIGGTYNKGTVFEILAGNRTIITLASFNGTNGANPHGGLIEDSSGNLYGTTNSGGNKSDGTIFEIAAGNRSAIITLATFNGTNGANPDTHLVDLSGNLYGATTNGGANSDGTLFELPSGNHTIITLLSFNGTNGANPRAGLLADSYGNLYGTAYSGGANDDGTLFEWDAGNSTLSTLVIFNGTNGTNPHAKLVADAAGNLYGTTQFGGTNNDGTVFELMAGNGTLNTLVTFNGSNGAQPEATDLLMDAAGDLYGTTNLGGDLTLNGGQGDGTAFRINAGNYTIYPLTFEGSNGSNPISDGVVDAYGNIYGTTYAGGAYGDGTVFEVTNAGFAQTSITVIAPNAQTANARQSTSFIMGNFMESYATGPYTLTVNWGDGTANSVIENIATAGSLPSATHTYASQGNETVTETVMDSANNTSSSVTFTVDVGPALVTTITLTAPSNQTAATWQSKSFTLGNFTQVNASGPFNVMVNWGDGSPESNVSVLTAGIIPATTHTYYTGGNDTVTLTVTDSASHTSNTATFNVTVAATSIVLTPAANQTTTPGQSQLIALGSFTQSNATGPFTVTVNWGDGSAESVISVIAAGNITATSHIYSNIGNDTVAVTVTDSANHTSNSALFGVTVAPAWYSSTGTANWNASTQMLTVSGNMTITADPATYDVAPIIAAGNGSQVVLSTSVVHIGGLSLQSGATLDIGNDTLFINYGNGSTPLAAVQAAVAYGAGVSGASGANGSIISSTANAGNSGQYAVGYADSTELASIASGNVEVMYTLAGDANLDGRVNFNDFSLLQNNYDTSGADWSQGDFNHDGRVNFNDFSILQNNYDTSIAASVFSSAAIGSDTDRAANSMATASSAAAVYRIYTPNAQTQLFTNDLIETDSDGVLS